MYHLVARVDDEGNFLSACGVTVDPHAGVKGHACTACVVMTRSNQDLPADLTAVMSQA